MTEFEVLGIEIKEKTIKMNALSNLVNKKMKMYAFLRLQKKWIKKVVNGKVDGMRNVQYFSPDWSQMSQLQKTIPTGENFDWSQIFNKTYLSIYFFDEDKNNRMIPFSASEGSKMYNPFMLLFIFSFTSSILF